MTGEPRPRYNALQLLGVSGACGSNTHAGPTVTWSLLSELYLVNLLALHQTFSITIWLGSERWLALTWSRYQSTVPCFDRLWSRLHARYRDQIHEISQCRQMIFIIREGIVYVQYDYSKVTPFAWYNRNTYSKGSPWSGLIDRLRVCSVGCVLLFFLVLYHTFPLILQFASELWLVLIWSHDQSSVACFGRL